MASPEDNSLLNEWKAGSEAAAQQLFDRYVDRLVALARKRLSQRLARRIDAEDIVQSVFRTFFTHARQGQFTIENEDDLCKLLYRITVHKTLRQVHFHQAAKRDVRQEDASGQEALQGVPLFAREPDPEVVNMFLEQMEQFLGRLEPLEQQILEMRLQGYGTGEIAKKLGTYERKITRTLERIRGFVQQDEKDPN